MNLCLICQKNKRVNSGDLLLSNKLFVHKSCTEDLYKKIVLIENENKDPDKNSVNIELNDLKTLQKSIYDYWPSYPPDWNERKQRIKQERKTCSRCGKTSTRKYRKYPLEFHHTIPINAGGNHLDSNVELICKSCHKKEHEKNPYKFRKKKINIIN